MLNAPPLTDRPWMTALEMQYAALHSARWLLSRGTDDAPSDIRAALAAMQMASVIAVRTLPTATPFYWSDETANAVLLASRSIPRNTPLDPSLISFENAFWYFNKPLSLPNRETPVTAMSVTIDRVGGLGFSNSGPQLVVVYYSNDHGHIGGTVGALRLPFGKTLYEVAADQVTATGNDKAALGRAFDILCFILAASSWLNQRIIASTAGPVTRHRRKALAKEFGADISEVKIIQLRRMESREPTSAEHQHVDWSHRWVVSGHWRNQYHPSTGKHELKCILPYVKGPEDKPLKVPKAEVFVVNR